MSTITVFVCNHCGHVAHAVAQPSIVPNREPITQVECHDIRCRHYMVTTAYRSSDPEAVEQTALYYTAVVMDESQVARFIEAIDSKGELS